MSLNAHVGVIIPKMRENGEVLGLGSGYYIPDPRNDWEAPRDCHWWSRCRRLPIQTPLWSVETGGRSLNAWHEFQSPPYLGQWLNVTLAGSLPFCKNRMLRFHKYEREHFTRHTELYYKVWGRSTQPIYLAKLDNIRELLVCSLD